ncbi:MAG: TM0106 family RecB-like putative nuclease, partial [Cyanobacteria bacterium P01_F01_bin.116]
MDRKITSETVVAYWHCPRKAYLLLFENEEGKSHEYVNLLEQEKIKNRNNFIKKIVPQLSDQSYKGNLKSASDFLVGTTLQTEIFETNCDLLTKLYEPSDLGNFSYEPTIFVGKHSIDKYQKIHLGFIGYILGKLQKALPNKGKIITANGKSHKIKLKKYSQTVIPILDNLKQWKALPPKEALPIILNKHCPYCQFQNFCQEIAQREDNLSLLDRITPKEKHKYERRGILTIKQLSYIFRPRKPRKRIKGRSQYSHKFELQALALRTQKIYLQESPNISRRSTEIFLDIESIPDQNFYYLIGLLICQKENSKQYSFWADSQLDEVKIWNHFLEITNEYPEALIYHYGSFEQKAIAKLGKRYDSTIDNLIPRLKNLTSYIYGKIYFPTYSNKLKEIGACLGAKWSSPNASGLQSLIWRHKWNLERNNIYKSYLLQYNTEDCLATKLLLDELDNITDQARLVSELDFGDRYKRPSSLKDKSIHKQLEAVLKFSYANLDKKKIRFREKGIETGELNHKSETKPKPKNKKRKKSLGRPTRIRYLEGIQNCPTCKNIELKESNFSAEKLIIDLIFSKNGVKKSVIKYCVNKGFCPQCKRFYIPRNFRKRGGQKRYGEGFNIWFSYQRVAHRLSHHAISQLTEDLFNEKIDSSTVTRLIKEVANYYAETEELLVKKLQNSHFVHVDETPISIRGVTQYVWVLTNGLYVFFRLTETREVSAIQSFFQDYRGVLISDFYAGYDSIECQQQKCWVHLIRDLNTDLWKSPFDNEFEKFVQEIKDLIIPIMEAL